MVSFLIGGVNPCVRGILNLQANGGLLQDKQDGDYDYEELVEEKRPQTSSNIRELGILLYKQQLALSARALAAGGALRKINQASLTNNTDALKFVMEAHYDSFFVLKRCELSGDGTDRRNDKMCTLQDQPCNENCWMPWVFCDIVGTFPPDEDNHVVELEFQVSFSDGGDNEEEKWIYSRASLVVGAGGI